MSQVIYDWVKGLPTQNVQDPGGLAITTKTEYDAQGRVTKQLRPGATGTDAATRVTTYWAASGTGTCQGRPEWADLVCSTGVAGAIAGGGINPSQVPTTTTEYNWWGRSSTVRDTANGSTRSTTIQYDAAGRPTKTTITGGIGQAVPEFTTEYDPATGRPVKLTSPTGGTMSKAYDKLGRQRARSGNTGYPASVRAGPKVRSAPATGTTAQLDVGGP
jgi:YD repeat-containing protein